MNHWCDSHFWKFRPFYPRIFLHLLLFLSWPIYIQTLLRSLFVGGVEEVAHTTISACLSTRAAEWLCVMSGLCEGQASTSTQAGIKPWPSQKCRLSTLCSLYLVTLSCDLSSHTRSKCFCHSPANTAGVSHSGTITNTHNVLSQGRFILGHCVVP